MWGAGRTSDQGLDQGSGQRMHRGNGRLYRGGIVGGFKPALDDHRGGGGVQRGRGQQHEIAIFPGRPVAEDVEADGGGGGAKEAVAPGAARASIARDEEHPPALGIDADP
ncbi:MAG TPA: hypothetical protein PLO34_10860, partial [Pseudoxanthomonas sp.]|nr:hypothetical protein [Pseudoxanthomonas sp.]